MKKQALTAIEIDALTAPDERREQSRLVAEATLRSRRLDDAPRYAGLSTPWLSPAPPWPGSMSASGLDEPNVSGDQTSRKDETSPRQRDVATTHHDPDGWPFD
jgi:inosine-uridine nucleoside N-ribohydrolase